MATTAETTQTEQQSNGQVTVAIVFGAVLALVGIAAPVVAGSSGEFVVFGRNYLHAASTSSRG